MYLVNNLSNKYADLSHLMQLVGVLKSPLSPLRTCCPPPTGSRLTPEDPVLGGRRGRWMQEPTLPWTPGGCHYTNEDFM